MLKVSEGKLELALEELKPSCRDFSYINHGKELLCTLTKLFQISA